MTISPSPPPEAHHPSVAHAPDGPNPSGLCLCGCGGKTSVAKQTDRAKGYVKGQPVRYIVGHQDRGKKKPACHTPEHLARKREREQKYKRQWYENNRERLARKRKERYWENPEAAREASRKWRKENPERLAANGKAYYEANKTQVIARVTAAQHVHRNRRRARLHEAIGDFTAAEIDAMYRDQGGRCAYCERPLDGFYHIDHMIPLCRGGRNDWTNLALACQECNSTKHTKTAEEFMRTWRRELGEPPRSSSPADERNPVGDRSVSNRQIETGRSHE